MGLLSGIAISATLSELIRRGLRSISVLEPLNYPGAMVLLIAVCTAPAVPPLRRDFLVEVARIPSGVYRVGCLLIRAVSKPFLNGAAERVEIVWSIVPAAVDEKRGRAVDTAADAAGNILTHPVAIGAAGHGGLQL